MKDKEYDWFCRFCEVFELKHIDEQIKAIGLTFDEIKKLDLIIRYWDFDDWQCFTEGSTEKHLIARCTKMTCLFAETPNHYRSLLQKAKSNNFSLVPLDVLFLARFMYKNEDCTTEAYYCNELAYGSINIISKNEVEWEHWKGGKRLRANIHKFFIQCDCLSVENLEHLLIRIP
jgi:hypothetical protein